MLWLPIVLIVAMVPAAATNPKSSSITTPIAQPKPKKAKTVVTNQVTFGENRIIFGNYGFRSSLNGYTVSRSEAKGNGGYSLDVFQGRSLPKFNEVWDDGAVDLVERDFSGIKLNHNINKSNSYSISAYDATDSSFAGKTHKQNDYHYRSLSFTSKLSPDVTLSMDQAYSGYTNTKNTKVTRNNGTAMRYQMNRTNDKGSLVAEYEFIDPSFTTKLGSTVTDRERFRLSGSQITKNNTISLSETYYHNNVAGQLKNTTHDYSTELKFDRRKLFAREKSVATILIRHHATSGKSQLDETTYSTSWKDQVGDVAVQATVAALVFSPGQSKQKVTMTTNITASSTIQHDSVKLRPSITIGSKQNRNDQYESNDVISTYALGMGADFVKTGWSTDLSLGYRIRDKASSDFNDEHTFANLSVGYKPKWMLLGTKPTMGLKWLWNSYEMPSLSVEKSETRLVASLNLMF